MPNIEIIKLKIRRGTNTQRLNVVLEQGELGYTTDTNRVYVGDGITLGGQPVGSLNLAPTITPGTRTSTVASINDVIYDNNILWQLTAADYTQLSSWANIEAKPDNSYLQYDGNNKLTIVSNSIGKSKLASDIVYSSGAIYFNSTTGLSANVDGSSIVISSNRLALPIQSISTPAGLTNSTVNNYGIVTSKSTIEGYPLSARIITANHPFSAFNGFWNQTTFIPNDPGRPVISPASTVLEADTTTSRSLTSAGFMTLSTNSAGVVAVPIFKFS